MTSISSPLIVSLDQKVHQIAMNLASEQSTPTKGKQVYLSALAVYAVSNFLEWIEIETDLNKSDSLNPLMSNIFDTADLLIPGIGRLECCVVLSGENSYQLLLDPLEDLIGYVAVEFSQKLDAVRLLGFIPAVDISLEQEQFLISELQPLDSLESYLQRIKAAKSFIETNPDPVIERVRAILMERNISEIVAQLERIYRNCRPSQWRYAVAEVISNSLATLGTERELSDANDNPEFERLAKNLMEKLDEIWKNIEI